MKNNFLKKIKDKKKTNIIIAFLVVLGVILIVSTFIKEPEKAETENLNHSEYIALLEEKIAKIASNVTGLQAEATLTLETGTEYVYLDQNTTEQEKNEQSYIVVDDGSGGQKALIVTEKMPQIRGVVVIAKGATNSQKTAIKEAVAALLNIRSSKISVIN